MKEFTTLTELSQALASLGSLAVDGKGTICVDTLRVTTSPSSAEPMLPLTSGDAAEVALVKAISRGGMGEIFAARQASLRRGVAVKRPLRDDVPDAARAIVAEARVCGALEHPNIVPVHLLGVDERGLPLLVMKRIEGQTWSALLREGVDLARDVEIMMDVCRALHFAHSHGVVHRDVKPANVMVGSFGEVYLLDWGIAVAHSDDAPGELPRARDVASIAGTPGYMAPEMAYPTGEISPRTDVFLAGATLFDVVTGSRPWVGESIEEQLFDALRCRLPDFAPSVPEELASVVRKAMHRDPSQRYASAEEMRIALARYRDHAAVRALCDEAEARLAVLQRDDDVSASGDRKQTAQVFAECRFGFTQALRAWPESARAQRGLASAIEAMARREIASGHVDSASLLVDELLELDRAQKRNVNLPLGGAADAPGGSAYAELRAGLGALEARRASEVRSVEELARERIEHDIRQGDRERAVPLLIIGVVGFIAYAVLEVLHDAGRFGAVHFDAGAGTLVLNDLVTLALIGVFGRSPALRATNAARIALRTMVTSVLSLLVLHTTCFFLDVSTHLVVTVTLVVLGTLFIQRAALDLRMWRATLATWLFVAPTAAFPDHAWILGGLGVLAGFAATAWIGFHSESTRSSAR